MMIVFLEREKTIEFVCADFLILVCKRGYCDMFALALSHTH